MLGDPPTLKIFAEKVELVGGRPYRRAVVTSCDVNNIIRVADTRNGEVEFVGGSRTIQANRSLIPVRLTKSGWKRYAITGTFVEEWERLLACPAN